MCIRDSGRLLGIEGKFLTTLSKKVIEVSKDGYPELADKEPFIFNVINEEEDKFNKTIDQGLSILSEMEAAMVKDGEKVLNGADAFKLYETYGFPLDLTKEILEEKGFGVDEDGFAASMKEQKEKARKARKTTNYMGADVTVYQTIDPNLTSVDVYKRQAKRYQCCRRTDNRRRAAAEYRRSQRHNPRWTQSDGIRCLKEKAEYGAGPPPHLKAAGHLCCGRRKGKDG